MHGLESIDVRLGVGEQLKKIRSYFKTIYSVKFGHNSKYSFMKMNAHNDTL